MKKTIVLVFIITAYLFPQGWNSIVTTTINEPNLIKMDLFSNKDGNHVIVQNSNASNSIKYYLLNTSGTLVRSSTIETSGSAEFPNISGNHDKVYLVYKLSSNLKLKKSTNAGQSWTALSDQGVGNNLCNGVDIIYNSNGLHVVYATKDNGDDFETYYRLIGSNDVWGSQETVTNYDANTVGGWPTVSVSTDRVHVSYNTGQSNDPWGDQGDANTRDEHNNTWQTPQLVFSTESFRERVHAGASKLFDFYYDLNSGPRADLYVKERSLSSSSWSSATFLKQSADAEHLVSATNTYDAKTHIVYTNWDFGVELAYRSYNGSSWSSETEIGDDLQSGWPILISSVSNDLYVAWQSGNYIHYRQYDANPLTPSNFAISTYNGAESGYPKLDWSLNNEPDVRIATRGYLIERRLDLLGDGTWSAWSQIDSIAGSVNTYIDYSLSGAGSGPNIAEYKIRAQDKNWHRSNYTSALQIDYGTGYWKMGSGIVKNDLPDDFSMAQNYPNPFNPTTNITYSLPEDSKVQIKVYDMLGTEVAELINETKPAGFYEATFDASNLSSGVYIYRIIALSGDKILFTQSKQMILIK